jgi:hypothetical protein
MLKKQIPLSKMSIVRIKFLCLITILPVFLIIFSGCIGDLADVKAKLGEEFTIGIGESARITGEDMVITFNEVTADSRCPEDVTCVWAGEAACSITVISSEDSYAVELIQSGASDKNEEVFLEYTLTFSLEPYPKSTEEISQKDYKLTITVTK